MSAGHTSTPPPPRPIGWLYGPALVALALLTYLVAALGHSSWIDEPTDLDHSVHLWVVRSRAEWPLLTGFFRLATRFGNPSVATLATAAVAIGLYALYRRGVPSVRRSEPLVWVGVILGGRLFSLWLKAMYRRERPPVLHRLVPETTFSFPSGHSVFAAAFFSMLALLLSRLIPADRPRLRFAAFAVCALAAFLIAASRVWLGVHYPTDVAAGLLLGAGWVFAVWLVRLFWKRYRERPTPLEP